MKEQKNRGNMKRNSCMSVLKKGNKRTKLKIELLKQTRVEICCNILWEEWLWFKE